MNSTPETTEVMSVAETGDKDRVWAQEICVQSFVGDTWGR